MLRLLQLAACLAGATAFSASPSAQRCTAVRGVLRARLPAACAPAEPAADPPADAQPAEPPAPAISTYADAEARGFELHRAGEYERAIRMFELAQTLPGEGVDYKRQKVGGVVGSATAPPNPREWGVDRFATAEQKLIAQYNIACCYAALGDSVRALEVLRAYVASVDEPLNQINEMLVDDDLLSIRAELRTLRETYKGGKSGGKGLFGIKLPDLASPIREAADKLGVEWKD